MNKIFGVDNITASQYGFRVLPFPIENAKGENELLVIVRISNEVFSEFSLNTIIADAYNSFYAGEVRVRRVNLADLDEKKIAELFSQFIKEYASAHSIHVSRVSKEHDALLFIYGNNSLLNPNLSRGIIYFDKRIKELENSNLIDQRELSVLFESSELFFVHASLHSLENTQIQSLKDRIQKLKEKEVANLEKKESFTAAITVEPSNKRTKTDSQERSAGVQELAKKFSEKNLDISFKKPAVPDTQFLAPPHPSDPVKGVTKSVRKNPAGPEGFAKDLATQLAARRGGNFSEKLAAPDTQDSGGKESVAIDLNLTETIKPPKMTREESKKSFQGIQQELAIKLGARIGDNLPKEPPVPQTQGLAGKESCAIEPTPMVSVEPVTKKGKKNSADKEGLGVQQELQRKLIARNSETHLIQAASPTQSIGDRLNEIENQLKVLEKQEEFEGGKFNALSTDLQGIMGQQDLKPDDITRIKSLTDKMTRLVFRYRLNEIEKDLKLLENQTFDKQVFETVRLKLQGLLDEKNLIDEEAIKIKAFMDRMSLVINKVFSK